MPPSTCGRRVARPPQGKPIPFLHKLGHALALVVRREGMRRAAWRPSPHEPRNGPARVLRGTWDSLTLDDLPAWIRVPRDTVFVSALVVLFVLSPVLLVMWADARFGLFVSLPIAAAVIVLVPLRILRACRRSRSGVLDRLLPLPLPEGTFPVDVAVRHRGLRTGTDEAVASFVDGWLHVEGLRTSFSLRPGDGLTEWRKERLRIAFPDGGSVTLGVQGVILWIARGRKPEPQGGGFADCAEAWIGVSRPSGESLVPPKGVHPDVRACWTFATILDGLLFGLALRLAARGDEVFSFLAAPSFLLGIGLLLLLASASQKFGEAEGKKTKRSARERSPAIVRDPRRP